MDEYTKYSKRWLDNRFKSTDKNGVYKSHAAIYGFSKDLLSLGIYQNNYAIIKEIQKICEQFKIENFLEVGCAEGYTTHLIKEIFGFKAYVCDLSTEAVKRAREIYGFNGFVSDVQELSHLKENCFDLVLCSETIEHVPDPFKAFQELKRITKKALIITVPAAKNLKEKKCYRPPKGPHTHLNIFTKKEIENLTSGGNVKGISINWLYKLESLCTYENKNNIFNWLKNFTILNRIIKLLLSPIKNIYCVPIAEIFIRLDYFFNRIVSSKVYTYMVTYKKCSPEFYYENKSDMNIIKFILKYSKVKPHLIDT